MYVYIFIKCTTKRNTQSPRHHRVATDPTTDRRKSRHSTLGTHVAQLAEPSPRRDVLLACCSFFLPSLSANSLNLQLPGWLNSSTIQVEREIFKHTHKH